MKKLLLLSFVSLYSVGLIIAQSAGFNSSYAVLSLNGAADTYYCLPNNTSCGTNSAFDGANLGTFFQGANTMVLKGAEHNVFKCGGADITATNFNYRIYKTGNTPGSFNIASIGFSAGGANGCGGEDQQWKDLNKNINVLSGLTPGSYTLEVYSDAATTLGAQFLSNSSANYKASFIVGQPLVVSASANPTSVCSGQNVTLSAGQSGGSAPYTYVWSGSDGSTPAAIASPVVTPTVTTTYSVTVTDNIGTTATGSALVTVKSLPTANAGADVTVTCSSPNTLMSATGGTSYAWSNGASQGGFVSPTITTTYLVTVTGSNGCTAVDDKKVTADRSTTANAGADVTLNCTNTTTTLTATGGISYAWSSGEATASITVSPATTKTYTVTVTGSNGCTGNDAVVVTVDRATPIGSAGPNGLINCNIASATLTASGGVSYLWNNGATTASITGSPTVTTNYTVVITGANTCTTSAITAIIVDRTPPIANAGPDLTFNSANPTVTMTASGGVSYIWSNGVTTASNTVTPTQATTYTVTVTGSNGCTGTDNTLVSFGRKVNLAFAQPQIIGNKFRVALRLTAPEAFGLGSTNFRFNYNNSALSNMIVVSEIFPSPSFGATTLTGTVQTTGIASINTAFTGATDANLIPVGPGGVDVCVLEFTITNPALATNLIWRTSTTPRISILDDDKISNLVIDQALNLNYPLTPVQITSLTNTNNLCFGALNGTAQVVAQNGLPPYTYLWSNGATSASITGLAAGVYTVSVTDAAAITISQSVTVTEPSELTATFTQTNVACVGGNDGSVVFTVSGGTPTYSILPNSNALTAGNYTFTITDANGCSITKEVIILDGFSVNAGSDITITCTNPSATLSVSGGVSYIWSNGETNSSITVTPTTQTTYSVTATGSNGCTDTDEVVVSVDKIVPVADAGADVTVDCSIPSRTLTAVGGVSFMWSTGETTETITVAPLTTTTYTLTVTAANGCTDDDNDGVVVSADKIAPTADAGADVTVTCTTPSTVLTATGGVSYIWNNGATQGASVSPLTTTTYNVTVSAANGCTATDNMIVTADKSLVANAGPDVSVNCTVLSATLTATGGVAYLWSNGETTASTTVSPLVTTTYTVTVTAANGCSATDDVKVTSDTAAPNGTAGADGLVNCNVTFTTLTASGGVSYLWSNGATTQSIQGSQTITTDYTVTITGANTCTMSDVATVVVDKTPPPASAGPDITISASNPIANLLASGGIAYLWSNGVTTASNPVSPLVTTTYSVTVTGANGCKASDLVLVTLERKINIAFVDPQVVGNKFRVSIKASANQTFGIGSSNFRFNYNNAALSSMTVLSEAFPSPAFGATTLVGTNQATGIASVNTTYVGAADANILPIGPAGLIVCQLEFTITNPLLSTNLIWRTTTNPRTAVVDDDKITSILIDQIVNMNFALTPLQIASLTKTDNICFGASTGSAQVTAQFGLSPLSYLWSNGATTTSISGLAAGVYTVSVTDAFPTTISQSVTIQEPTPLSVTFTQQNVTCFGGNDGSVTFNISGGTPNQTLTTGGAYGISPNPNGLSAGTYTFTITDANGCSITQQVTILDGFQNSVNAGADVTINCTNPSAVLTATGGSGSFAWSTGANSASITVNPPSETIYSVTITSSNGCTATDEVQVSIDKTAPVASAGSDVTVSCTTPSTTLLATGGTSYAWSNGANSASITVTPTIITTYIVTVTSANGCTATDEVVVGVDKSGPVANAGLDITITYGSNAVLTASGGLTYAWSNGVNTATNNVSPNDRTTYIVTVTAANGCTATDAVIVAVEKKYNLSFVNSSIIGNKFRFTIRMSTSTPFCIGSSNLRFNFNKSALNNLTIISDAFPSPQYGATTTLGTSYTSGIASLNTSFVGAASTCLIPISSGGVDLMTCEFTIIDPAQFTQFVWRNTSNPISSVVADDKFTVCIPNQLIGLNAPLSVLNISGFSKNVIQCFGSGTGYASVETTGGLPPFTYSWSNGATTQTNSNLFAGTYTVTVYDSFGYSASSSVTLTELPAVDATFTQTKLLCNGLSNASVNFNITGGTAPYTVMPSPTNLSEGSYTFTITDTNGCSKTVSTTIVVEDLIAPVFVLATVPDDMTINCTDAIVGHDMAEMDVHATDNCGAVTVALEDVSTQDSNPSNCGYYSYTLTRTWTATDEEGNTSTVRQIITVQDKTAPILSSGPADVTVKDVLPTAAVLTASDNCTTPQSVVYVQSAPIKLPLPPCTSYKEIYVRTWTATDICGNSSVYTQNILFTGDVLLTCPKDLTLNTNSDLTNRYDCATTVQTKDPVTPVFSDICDLSILRFTITGATNLSGNGTISGTLLSSGVNNVQYVAANSLASTCSFTVTVVDLEAPKITMPSTLATIITDGCAFLPAYSGPSASDNCSAVTLTPTVISEVDLTGCAVKSATGKFTRLRSVQWTATDLSGNTATTVQKIYLRDMVAPVAVCKDLTISIGAANIVVPAPTFNSTSFDACSNVLSFAVCNAATNSLCTNFASSITFTRTMIPTGSTSKVIPVRLRVTDGCGNVSYCTSNVTLVRATTLDNTGQGNKASVSNDTPISNKPTVPSNVLTTHGDMQCFPNPFSEDLNINYNLTEKVDQVVIKLYDNQGKVLKVLDQGESVVGYYTVRWNLSNLNSGMYHVCLEFNDKCQKLQRVIMIK